MYRLPKIVIVASIPVITVLAGFFVWARIGDSPVSGLWRAKLTVSQQNELTQTLGSPFRANLRLLKDSTFDLEYGPVFVNWALPKAFPLEHVSGHYSVKRDTVELVIENPYRAQSIDSILRREGRLLKGIGGQLDRLTFEKESG